MLLAIRHKGGGERARTAYIVPRYVMEFGQVGETKDGTAHIQLRLRDGSRLTAEAMWALDTGGDVPIAIQSCEELANVMLRVNDASLDAELEATGYFERIAAPGDDGQGLDDGPPLEDDGGKGKGGKKGKKK